MTAFKPKQQTQPPIKDLEKETRVTSLSNSILAHEKTARTI
jgi:hypothetical protein